MTLDVAGQVQAFREMADLLELPYGDECVDPQWFGENLTKLIGDRNRARALYKTVLADYGYVPQCVANVVGLLTPGNIVPDVEAPDPT